MGQIKMEEMCYYSLFLKMGKDSAAQIESIETSGPMTQVHRYVNWPETVYCNVIYCVVVHYLM